MTITLYTSTADERRLDKSPYLQIVKSVSGAVVKGEQTDILAPVVELATFSGFASVNYAYIPEWGRYYFIRGIDVMRGGRIALTLEVDTLMTYRADIAQINAVAVRSETAGAGDLPDSVMPFSSDKQVRTIILPSSAFILNGATETSLSYILNIAGGGANES